MAYIANEYRLPMLEIIDGKPVMKERSRLPPTLAELDERMISALAQFHPRKPGEFYIAEKDRMHIIGDGLKEES